MTDSHDEPPHLAAAFVVDNRGRLMLAGRVDAYTDQLGPRLAVLETAWPIAEDNEWQLKTRGPDGTTLTVGMSWRLAEPRNRRYRRFIGHRLEIHGFRSSRPDPSGPVVALRGVLLEGDRFDLDIQVWYATAWRDDSPIYAELFWTPTLGRLWQSGGYTNPPSATEQRRVTAALAFLDLGTQHGQGGRTPTSWETKVDRLAKAGVTWLNANQRAGRHVAVEDFGRLEMGEATNRGEVAINKHMGRVPIVLNEHIHQRMHELLDEEKSVN